MIFSKISTPTLAFAAAGGAVLVLGFGHLVRDNIVRRHAGRRFYNDAVRVARKDPGVEYLLGLGFVDQGRIRSGSEQI